MGSDSSFSSLGFADMQKFRSAFEEAQEAMSKLLGTVSKEEDEAADVAADALSGLKVVDSGKKVEKVAEGSEPKGEAEE